MAFRAAPDAVRLYGPERRLPFAIDPLTVTGFSAVRLPPPGRTVGEDVPSGRYGPPSAGPSRTESTILGPAILNCTVSGNTSRHYFATLCMAS
jgi:hypothetical protein